MRKKELLKLPALHATSRLMELAEAQVLKKGPYFYSSESYDISAFIRFGKFGKILKAAVFFTEDLKMGARTPRFEIYMEKTDYITYDRMRRNWLTASVERLPVPGYVHGFTYNHNNETYISDKDKALFKAFTGYSDIISYQRNILHERLIAKHKRVTDKWDAFLNKMLPAMPKGFDKWATTKGMVHHYIFYEKAGAKTGRCSCCNEEVKLVSPRHNVETACPVCGTKATFKSLAKLPTGFAAESEYANLIQKTPDGIVNRSMLVSRNFKKDDENIVSMKCTISPVSLAFYDEQLENTFFQMEDYKCLGKRWVKYNSLVFPAYHGLYEPYYRHYSAKVYPGTLPSLKKTVYEKSGLSLFVKAETLVAPEYYLSAVKARPYIENFVKAGMTDMAKREFFEDRSIPVLVDENDDTSGNIVKLDGARLARFKAMNGTRNHIIWLLCEKNMEMRAKAAGLKNVYHPFADEDIVFFADKRIMPKDLKAVTKRISVKQAHNYLKKISCMFSTVNDALKYWLDYLSMAERLKYDLTASLHMCPKDIKRAHDEAVDACKYESDVEHVKELLEKLPDIEKNIASVHDKYSFKSENYSVVMPESAVDIIRDGRALSHCCGSSDIYFEEINNRMAYIGFIRKTDTPDCPLYTIEFQPGGGVRQFRMTGNKSVPKSDPVYGFLAEWQKEVQSRLTDEDRLMDETSDFMRLQNIAELRKKNTLIRNGYLRGKPLADELEASWIPVEKAMMAAG